MGAEGNAAGRTAHRTGPAAMAAERPQEYEGMMSGLLHADAALAAAVHMGHLFGRHCRPGGLLQGMRRVAGGGIAGDTQFPSADAALRDVRDALLLRRAEVREWLAAPESAFPGPEGYGKKTMSVYLGRPVGRGLDSGFREIECHAVRLVLRREDRTPTPLGFSLRTAFPDMREEHARPSGMKHGRGEVLSACYGMFADDMERAAFLHASPGRGVRSGYIESGPRAGQAWASQGRYTAYILPDGSVEACVRPFGGPRWEEPAGLSELAENAPAAAGRAAAIQESLRSIEMGRYAPPGEREWGMDAPDREWGTAPEQAPELPCAHPEHGGTLDDELAALIAEAARDSPSQMCAGARGPYQEAYGYA